MEYLLGEYVISDEQRESPLPYAVKHVYTQKTEYSSENAADCARFIQQISSLKYSVETVGQDGKSFHAHAVNPEYAMEVYRESKTNEGFERHCGGAGNGSPGLWQGWPGLSHGDLSPLRAWTR